VTSQRPRRKVRIAIAIVIPVLFFLSLAAWGYSSPVGSSPDDDFHLPSIWCGLGERDGLCEVSADPDTRLVPASIPTSMCYARLSEQSADCWDSGRSGLTETPRVNFGLYPPVYYAVNSMFASPDVQASVAAIRVFNAALYVLLMTGVFWALPRWLRTAHVVAAVATVVPLGLFIIPSTNPSSWAFLSASVVWISLLGALKTSGVRQVLLGALAVAGAALGAGARADAAIYAAFGAVVAAALGLRFQRRGWIPAAFGAGVVIVSALLYLSAGQGGSVTDGLNTELPPLTPGQHLYNLLGVPQLWVGAFGAWGLGWLDTEMPATVWVGVTAVVAGAVFVGIRSLTPRRALTLGLAVAAAWGVPFVLQAQARMTVGSYVQPRYILPLLIILVGVATAAVAAERWWTPPRRWVAVAVLAVGAAIALHTNIRRYTTGLDVISVDPGARAEWWWPVAPSPAMIFLVGAVAFAVALTLLASIRPTRDDGAPALRDGEHKGLEPSRAEPSIRS
jgi:hypothetical protein